MTAVLSRLLTVASEQHGLFTIEQAAEAEVADDQVRRMAAQGVLERRAQGLYRIVAIPFNAFSEPMEAVLWAKGRALIAGPSALVLWDLADVNPRRIHLAVPNDYRPRRAGGDLYQVHQLRLTDEVRDEVQGVPAVTPATAIAQSIEWGVAGDMIEQAVTRALARELIGPDTARHLRNTLTERTGAPAAEVAQ